MPEVEHTMRTAAEEARSEDDIGAALNQGLQELRVLGWVIFEIGVLDDDEIASRLLNAAAERSALAHVMRLEERPNLRMFQLQLLQDFAGTIAGAVIHA